MYPIQKRNLNDLPIWNELSQLNIHEKLTLQLSHDDISLEILHHHLNFDALQLFAKFCEQQGFFELRQQFLKNISSPYMPKYIYQRSFSSRFEHSHPIFEMRRRMKEIADQIHHHEWVGYTGKSFKDIVNIGMGGSDLGPQFYYDAFKHMPTVQGLKCHFISDADYYSIQELLEILNPETTLFIISSKSFKTEETLMNAKIAQAWIGQENAVQDHFIAITSSVDIAKSLGYQHIIHLEEWIVGRYSCTTAINLVNVIAFGYEHYLAFLRGAHQMDEHFLNAPWHENLPMLLAFVGVWNINFCQIPTQLMLIYHSKLRYFYNYVQQLDMESNGKSYDVNGTPIDYQTAPIVWGGLGNPAQHSYFQLLAQGKHQVSIDFLSIQDHKNKYLTDLCERRKLSLFNGLRAENDIYTVYPQTSINHIQLNDLSPQNIGALIALYEHKVFIQSWIWNINPFEQHGVELMKKSIGIINSNA